MPFNEIVEKANKQKLSITIVKEMILRPHKATYEVFYSRSSHYVFHIIVIP